MHPTCSGHSRAISAQEWRRPQFCIQWHGKLVIPVLIEASALSHVAVSSGIKTMLYVKFAVLEQSISETRDSADEDTLASRNSSGVIWARFSAESVALGCPFAEPTATTLIPAASAASTPASASSTTRHCCGE